LSDCDLKGLVFSGNHIELGARGFDQNTPDFGEVCIFIDDFANGLSDGVKRTAFNASTKADEFIGEVNV
jgi:hypothetical protein